MTVNLQKLPDGSLDKSVVLCKVYKRVWILLKHLKQPYRASKSAKHVAASTETDEAVRTSSPRLSLHKRLNLQCN